MTIEPAPDPDNDDLDAAAQDLADFLTAADAWIDSITDEQIEQRLAEVHDTVAARDDRVLEFSITRSDDAHPCPATLISEAQAKADAIIAAGRRQAEDYCQAAQEQAAHILDTAQAVAHQLVKNQAPLPPPVRAGLAWWRRRDTLTAPRTHTVLQESADAWTRAIENCGVFLPMEHSDLRHLLFRSLTVIVTAAGQSPLPEDTVREVAHGLVQIGARTPAALRSSIQILHTHLTATGQDRRGEVLAAFAAGYTEALVADVLYQQTTLQQAARTAAHQRDLASPAPHELATKALYDPLTGLHNRTGFTQRLAHARVRQGTGRHLGVVLVHLPDLDRLSGRHEPASTDQILTTIAGRIAATIRAGDYLAARLARDEFAILIDDCAGTAHLIELAERIRGAVRQPVILANTPTILRTHIGLAEAATDHPRCAHLLHHADLALQHATSNHHDWVLYDPSTVTTDQRPDNFTISYRPVRSLADHSIYALRAHLTLPPRHTRLLRLANDNQPGNPRQALLTQMLTSVCRDAAGWRHHRAPLVNVPLPAPHVNAHELTCAVHQALTATGLAPQRLQLLIPEPRLSTLTTDDYNTFTALAARGVHLGIEDVGTGYTTLELLRRLPLTDLNITARLANACPDATTETILTALISMAHALDLTTTATGVDTTEQAHQLRHLGYDHAQGPAFGQPVAPTNVQALLDEHADAAARPWQKSATP